MSGSNLTVVPIVAAPTLHCIRPSPFSSDGFESFTHVEWWYEPVTWLLWVLLLVLIVSLILARKFDQRRRKEDLWRYDRFMTSDAVHSSRHRMFSNRFRSKQVPPGACCSRLRTLQLDTACLSVRLSMARLRNFSHRDLRLMLRGLEIARDRTVADSEAPEQKPWDNPDDPKQKHDVHDGVSQAVVDLCEALRLAEAFEEAAVTFERTGFCSKVGSLFVTLHPASTMCRFGITSSSSLRVLLWAVELLGALFLTAFYLTEFDDLLSWRSDAACKTRDFNASCRAPHAEFEEVICGNCKREERHCMQFFGQAILIGLCSRLLGWLPARLMRACRRQRFVHNKSWGQASKIRSIVWCWWRVDVAIVFSATSYCLFCILYLMTFLADTREGDRSESFFGGDRSKWFVCAFIALLVDIFVGPALVAVIVAALGGGLAWRETRSEYLIEIRQRFGQPLQAIRPPPEPPPLPEPEPDPPPEPPKPKPVPIDPRTLTNDPLPNPSDEEEEAVDFSLSKDKEKEKVEEPLPQDPFMMPGGQDEGLWLAPPPYSSRIRHDDFSDGDEPSILLVYAARGCLTCASSSYLCSRSCASAPLAIAHNVQQQAVAASCGAGGLCARFAL